MNVAAANTLLKFLEEPEGDVTAILVNRFLSVDIADNPITLSADYLFFHHRGK